MKIEGRPRTDAPKQGLQKIKQANMFGSRNPRPDPQRQPPPQQPPRSPYSRIPNENTDRQGGGYGGPPEKHEYASSRSRPGPGGQTWQLRPSKSPGPEFIYGNKVAVSPFDFPPAPGASEFYLIINDLFVVTTRQLDGFPQGQISLSDFQRSWAQISLQDTVYVRTFDPFSGGNHCYLGALDAEVSFAGKKEKGKVISLHTEASL